MLRANERLDQVIKKQNDCDSALQRAEAHQEMLENKVNVVTKEISQTRNRKHRRAAAKPAACAPNAVNTREQGKKEGG